MDLNKKLSDLTTINSKTFDKLSEYLFSIYSQDIVNSLLENKNIIELDIFEGKILLQLVDDNIKYKFIPSDGFNSMVVDTVLNKRSQLVTKINDRLKNQLINTYKDIL